MDDIIHDLCLQNPDISEERIRAYVIAKLRANADREYPPSFRSILPTIDDASGSVCVSEAKLVGHCHCGKCTFEVRVRGPASDQSPEMIRCMCRHCRVFHTSAFAAFVKVADGPADWTLGGSARWHSDRCDGFGEVNRLICTSCFTKLALAHSSEDGGMHVYLALGAVEDESVPEALARNWQKNFKEHRVQDAAAWWSSMPGPCQQKRIDVATGGCACGNCRFSAVIFPGEAQHCYCKLCRQLSGSAAMTWIPCTNTDFRWTKQESLRLVRTTRHGQRHICTNCGGTLTIVYDSQPDCTWPVAGALDDASLPGPDDESWYRVIHICCSMMQPWYQLPADGLPRLKYAG